MVAYWVRKGHPSSDDLTATCPRGDNGNLGCTARRVGPLLLAINRRPAV